MNTALRTANAQKMPEQRKQRITLEALSNHKSIRQITREHGVSRRFVRRKSGKRKRRFIEYHGHR